MSMLLSRDILLRPFYMIYINGNKIEEDLKAYITQVEVEESDSEATLGRISISDKDFIFSNQITLTEGAPIQIYMGHIQKYRKMLDGTITHIEADFGEEGIPYITIGAVDNTNKMSFEKKSRVFTNKTASEIVTLIAKEYGFTPKVQATSTILESVTQQNETDAQLIQRLAEDEAFKVYIVPNTGELYFGEMVNSNKAVDTIYYNSGDNTVISFRPTFIYKNKSNSVTTTSSEVSDTTGEIVTKTTTVNSGKPSNKSNAISNSGTVGISTATGAIIPNR